MKRWNILVMIFVFAAALFLTGCDGGNNRTSGTFVGGTEGLRISFMPGSPPTAIYDGGQFGFAIVTKIENVGEHTIAPRSGFVKINGLDPGTYGVSNFKKEIEREIIGARKSPDGNILNGMSDTVDFPGLKYIPVVQGAIQQTVWADLCYVYKTRSTTQLCIKTDPRQLLNNDKICTVEGEKYPQNSGAPLHVTSVMESFAGEGRIGLSMKITHVGKGDAFFDDRSQDCMDIESNPERGKVFVKVANVRVGGRTVTPKCTGLTPTSGTVSNEGYIRLYSDGSGKEEHTLYCTLEIGRVDTVFEVPMDVELTYKYLQHIEMPLEIRHAYVG